MAVFLFVTASVAVVVGFVGPVARIRPGTTGRKYPPWASVRSRYLRAG